ncbi:hypothetical protein PO878_00265 [Iamia majanohamensis]|uniref:Uncharacterized protein n=1 Tax=Iamia majanohamensis TaxID=467976 RepID=A0AAE9Y5V9_9ACTN|nr:hypothetical protein [Iamia majanohamensis]WCO67155.1 hypothetical protein PO878_00265 [Iamia majanohamensis]
MYTATKFLLVLGLCFCSLWFFGEFAYRSPPSGSIGDLQWRSLRRLGMWVGPPSLLAGLTLLMVVRIT